MTSFTELLSSAKQKAVDADARQAKRYQLNETWMQGRGIYGGLSTALCLDATNTAFSDLPPLRSASVNFIGPGSENVWVDVRELRRGKSVAFIEASLQSDEGLITFCVFSFGVSRESRLDENFGARLYGDHPGLDDPESIDDLFSGDPRYQQFVKNRPVFTQHFEARLLSGTRPFLGGTEPSMEVWVKHKDVRANDLVSLVALSDMPPPAVVPLFHGYSPFSSMTWMFNVLCDNPSSESGWWLLGSHAEHAINGYASQNMTIHNDLGELVVVGRQNVAIFY